MRKRVALVVAAATVVGGFVIGAEPAWADFHNMCAANSAPTAYVRITSSGSTLTYSGLVNCVGASVSIESLAFNAIDANGQSTGSASATPCTSCTGPVTASGSYQAPGPGTYTLVMAFTVTGAQGTNHRLRTERAAWAGAGPVVAVCGGTDQANQQNICPVP